jgi:hypothetical protein
MNTHGPQEFQGREKAAEWFDIMAAAGGTGA